MTDRELLELAAKVAGYDDAEWNSERGCIETTKLEGLRLYWNPLADDGDALRLAVRIHANIEIWNVDSIIRVNVVIKRQPYIVVEKYTDNADAATRRAIVRAAAEIGKMKGEKES